MALIHDIQNDLMHGEADLAPILLKLRFLATKLGSHPLAEWVKYEAEGYPSAVDLPSYRIIDISYKGTFSGPFGSGISNAPIPSHLINKFAGKDWSKYNLRQSVAAIVKLVSADKDGAGILNTNASDLILLLQGKVYENMACNEVMGTISVAQLKEVQHIVRSRILEIAMEIEQSIPESVNIAIGNSAVNEKPDRVSQIFYQTVHGNMSNVANSGNVESLLINMPVGDGLSIAKYVVGNGIADKDANEFSKILVSEKPTSNSDPFGVKAKEWISKNIPKALDGTWKASLDVASDVLKKAALSYYGLSS